MVLKLDDLPERRRSDSAEEFKKDIVRNQLTEQDIVMPRRMETQAMTTMPDSNDDLS